MFKAKLSQNQLFNNTKMTIQKLFLRYLWYPMKKLAAVLCVLLMGFSACKDTPHEPDKPQPNALYFPTIGSDDWGTSTPTEYNWDTSEIATLFTFLDDSKTRAFLVLKDGKMVLEHYNGKTILGTKDFDKTSQWYWASAGKTLTAFLVGQAQEDQFLNIDEVSSKYLGDWTSATKQQQDKITIRHQLTMTSGLDDKVSDPDCTKPSCLTYKADAGTRWAYHNAPYTILDSVVQQATDQHFDSYFNNRLRDPIGMDGAWSYLDYNHVYFSTARSMARYGLLVLNKGKWADKVVLADTQYIYDMTHRSQALNKSYGYLWWLNGQESHMIPSVQLVINQPIAPDAPQDMIGALGKNGQFLLIVPSQNIIVVRMGDNPEVSLVPTKYLNDLWVQLNKVIKP